MDELLDHARSAFLRPGRRGADQRFGIELEYPVVNAAGREVDEAVVYGLMEHLMGLEGAQARARDVRGRVIAVEHEGDFLAFEYCEHSLELSLAPSTDLTEIARRQRQRVGLVQGWLRDHDHFLAGLGVHPHASRVHPEPLEYSHYRMLRRFMSEYRSPDPDYHDRDFFGVINSSQVHVDAHEDDVGRVFDVLNRLDPVMGLLLANSVLVGADGRAVTPWTCNRDRYYAAARVASIPSNVGPWDRPFVDAESVCRATLERSAWYHRQGDRLEYFEPTPLHEFLRAERVPSIVVQDDLSFAPSEVRPDPSYLQSSFKSFTHVTLTRHHTVEVRGVCQQPIAEAMVPAALVVGCLEAVDAVEALLDELPPRETIRARRRAVASGGPLPLPEGWVERFLGCVHEGLRARGRGEEGLLAPLLARGATSPAASIHRALADQVPWERLVDDSARE